MSLGKIRDAVCSPASRTRLFLGYLVKWSITILGASEATDISTSPTVLAWRRKLPRVSACLVWGILFSHSMIESAIVWATGNNNLLDRPWYSVIPWRILAWESSPKPSILAIWPCLAAFSSLEMDE